MLARPVLSHRAVSAWLIWECGAMNRTVPDSAATATVATASTAISTAATAAISATAAAGELRGILRRF